MLPSLFALCVIRITPLFHDDACDLSAERQQSTIEFIEFQSVAQFSMAQNVQIIYIISTMSKIYGIWNVYFD